jgi:hypothetical protein
MYYLWLVWQFWVSFFPENEIFGSPFNTAAVAMIAAFAILGGILGAIFGRDSSVR